MEGDKLKVLFLCTGNSCRSQMAEGWVNHLLSDRVEAYSAGTRPSAVNSKAVQVMREAGVDISRQTSKSVDEFLEKPVDLLITLCDHAKETCPFFPGAKRKVHKGFEDPAEAKGTEREILDVFRKVRDRIKDEIIALLEDELK